MRKRQSAPSRSRQRTPKPKRQRTQPQLPTPEQVEQARLRHYDELVDRLRPIAEAKMRANPTSGARSKFRSDHRSVV